MGREPLKQVAVGGTGAGKTTENMRFIKNVYSNPKNPKARKTLIYDTNMEFPDIKPIAPHDIPKFNVQKQVEIRRVLPVDIATKQELGMDDKYELLCDIIDNYGFRNGLLYLEDINNYVIEGHKKHLINLLTTNRHKALDIFINLQTFGALPPRLWGNVNILRIHKCNDSPFQTKVKNQLSGKVEVLGIADILVNSKIESDPYFFVTVDFRNFKITGAFSLNEYVSACEKYLALNPRLIKREAAMNKISRDQAIKSLIYNLTKKYNGNVRLKTEKK
jgi:hypothetical protein